MKPDPGDQTANADDLRAGEVGICGSVRRVGWRQAICERCWLRRHPWRAPELVASSPVVREICSYCGGGTIVGIYLRDGSALVPFPRLEPGAS
ncbi:MAG TPA: hypothetical protein VGO31_14670 [Microbacteriaceae bacterium]|jgi:hypothetical protein|nr:hypothetical protein [Microbacteriaceae bacterium]